MCDVRCVMNWIEDMFGDLNKVEIKDYDRLSAGKKVMDSTGDYAIVYCDNEKDKVNYLFKEQ